MKVEVTEKRLSDQDEETGRLYVQEEGDIVTVPDALGEKWCSLGWAKDTEGKVTSGERVVMKNVRVQPKKATHKNTSQKAGGKS